MYPGNYAKDHPDRPAFIMASTGEAVTYREYEARANQLAHLFRSIDVQRLGHYSIFMENNDRYLESCAAGERSGLFYTCVNSYLTAQELAYIVDNSESTVVITSLAKRSTVLQAIAGNARVTHVLVVDDDGTSSDDRVRDYELALAGHPTSPIPDERVGIAMLYSSGTTGRPKGIIRPLPDQAPGEMLGLYSVPPRAVALPRGHGLSVAGAAVPLGAAGRREFDDPLRWHGHHHGALRSGRVPPPRRAASR